MLSRTIDDPAVRTAMQRLERKLRRDPATLLTDAEVELFAGVLEGEVAAAFPGVSTRASLDLFRDQTRWQALRARCRQAREERRWTVKLASVATGVPMYRIRAVEEGRLSNVRPALARRYFKALGIEPWVERWVRRNPELATRSGLAAPTSSASTRRPSERGWTNRPTPLRGDRHR